MAEKKKRSVATNAAIGISAGAIGGITNAVLTHPIDSLIREIQDNARKKVYQTLTPKDIFKAYGQKQYWKGVTASAAKKGAGFGIGLGATFAAEAQLQNLIEAVSKAKEESNLTKMGFHKA